MSRSGASRGQAFAHFICHARRAVAVLAQVAGQDAITPAIVYASFQCIRLFNASQRMPEQHRYGQQHRVWVGPFPGRQYPGPIHARVS